MSIEIKPLSVQEVRAIKALYQGKADEGQQTLAMACIIKKLCRTNALPYCGENTHDTALNLGRASVAKSILEAVNQPMKENT